MSLFRVLLAEQKWLGRGNLISTKESKILYHLAAKGLPSDGEEVGKTGQSTLTLGSSSGWRLRSPMRMRLELIKLALTLVMSVLRDPSILDISMPEKPKL